MKQTTIQITHIGEAPSPEAIKAAFQWTATQIEAVDLQNANYVSVSMPLPNGVQVDFNLHSMPKEAEAEATPE